MKTVCKKDQCAGCMACMDACPEQAISVVDSLKAYNAIIDESKCINCNFCHKICQTNHPTEGKKTIQWWQGWSINKKLRSECSSGGLATEIASAFVENGGIVWGCTFNDGEFRFESAENISEVKKFTGSKYVKSNPSGSYKKIKKALENKEIILFIGLPCQVSALKNYVGEELEKNLFTIDLICHGTPSPQLLETFLKQYGRSLKKIKEIKFRVKDKFMINGDYKGIITNGVSDKYSIAFLNSLTYTENCYNCHYAHEKRISDLTLGDSWGSEIQIQEQKKGISLILCQTQKGASLIEMTEVHLESVDSEKAIKNNQQLKRPSVAPKGREKFFDNLEKKNFNFLVFENFPKQCIRQDIKQFLIKTKIIGGERLNYEIYINEERDFK